MLRDGSLAKAKADCLKHGHSAKDIEKAAALLLERRKEYEDMDPAPIVDSDRYKWYCGPNATSRFWNGYVNVLKRIGWTPHMIRPLDLMTSKVVDLLDPPGNAKVNTRGLVVGKVQSGKTGHFTGVLAKAADSGYRLFIILSGITNSLRLQTQKRLLRDLGDDSCKGLWYWLTKPEIFGDFEKQNPDNANLALKKSETRSIAVVKKQATVLKSLIEWLNAGNGILRRDCPVLVIDDEADQASINTGKGMEWDELSKINGLIAELLQTLPKSAYVGYTATPFANVLIHPHYPQNLYPRSFIFPLDPPSEYFGPERIHGRSRLDNEESDEASDGLPLIRLVPDDQIKQLRPAKAKERKGFVFKMADSLRESIRYFLLATAARLTREREDSVPMDFSTMLIHTSHYVDVHQQSESVVRKQLERFGREIAEGDLDPWKELWERETDAIDRAKLKDCPPSLPFSKLKGFLKAAIDRTILIVSNSMRDEESNVTFDKKGQIAIVIGGNTLSRGLTLDGLVVSFFTRSANAYDTILQMGRWFGYRPKYEDLPRIWMTSEMKGQFYDLATIEQEFREEIDRYRALGLSPLQAAIRIRRHPGMRVTAPNKMRFAVTCETSYQGARPQTIYFKHHDKDWLKDNVRATERLLEGLGSPQFSKGGRWIWTGRPADEILSFVRKYRFHERSKELDSDLIVKYIEKQNRKQVLKQWNVVILGLASHDPSLGTLALRKDVIVNLINRSRIDIGDKDTAYIKALMSRIDILADKPEIDSVKLKGKGTDALFGERKNDKSGVLIIYPISASSKAHPPKGKESDRVDLGAVGPVIGVAFVFPENAEDPRGEDFVQAVLKPIVSEVSAEEEDPEAVNGA